MGLIGQLSPHLIMIEWLFLSHQPQRTITTYITVLCHLIIKGHEWTQRLFGYDPAFIHVPLTQVYLQQLATQCLGFQCAIPDFVGGLEINLSSDRLLQNTPFLQIRLAEKVCPSANNWGENCVSTRAQKNWTGCYCLARGQKLEKFCIIRTFLYPKGWAFLYNHGPVEWPQEPLNIVCNSGNTVYAILHLDQALIKTSIDPNLLNLFLTLQSLLDKQDHTLFITPIPSHSGLPGPLVGGNNKADALASVLSPSRKQQLISKTPESNLTLLGPKLSKLLKNVLIAKPLARHPHLQESILED